MLTVSPLASLVSTRRPPSLLCVAPPSSSQNVSTQIRAGDQGMRVWEEWVGWLIGWMGSRRGKGVFGGRGVRGFGGGGKREGWVVVRIRHPVWSLENSGIVPARTQHQH